MSERERERDGEREEKMREGREGKRKRGGSSEGVYYFCHPCYLFVRFFC